MPFSILRGSVGDRSAVRGAHAEGPPVDGLGDGGGGLVVDQHLLGDPLGGEVLWGLLSDESHGVAWATRRELSKVRAQSNL